MITELIKCNFYKMLEDMMSYHQKCSQLDTQYIKYHAFLATAMHAKVKTKKLKLISAR